jgi:hypothetical protein
MEKTIVFRAGKVLLDTKNLLSMMPNVISVAPVLEMCARYGLQSIDPQMDLLMVKMAQSGASPTQLDMEILATIVREISQQIKHEFLIQTRYSQIPEITQVGMVGFDLAVKVKE